MVGADEKKKEVPLKTPFMGKLAIVPIKILK